jgi:periplasmic copper chaperone A
MRIIPHILAAALLLSAGPAIAHDYRAGDIEIGHPWTRATPPSARVGGGYLTLNNEGGSPDRLVGASSPVAGRVEIHSMDMTDGVMRMRRLPDGIAIPAGGTVELAPGGLHLMLVDLAAPIEENGRVPLTLQFEHAGPVEIELTAGPVGATTPDKAGHRQGEAR